MVVGRIIEIFSILFIGYVLFSNFGQVVAGIGTAETIVPMLSVAALALVALLYAFNRFVA